MPTRLPLVLIGGRVQQLPTADTIPGTFTYVNVKDYGAVGNGTTDDSTAFTNAIAAIGASGGTVFIPAGTYNATISVTSKPGLRLLGSGPGTQIVPTNTSATAITIITCDRIRVESMRIRNCATALSVSGAKDGIFSDLIIDACTTAGIAVNGDNSTETHYKQITTRDCGIGFNYTRTVSTDTGGTYLDNCHFLYNTTGTTGIKASSIAATETTIYLWCEQVIVDGFTSGPAVDLNNVAQVRFTNTWIAGNYAAGGVLKITAGYYFALANVYLINQAVAGFCMELLTTTREVVGTNVIFSGLSTTAVKTASTINNVQIDRCFNYLTNLADSQLNLFKRTNLPKMGATIFATRSGGGGNDVMSFLDLDNPATQGMYLRANNGGIQFLKNDFSAVMLELNGTGTIIGGGTTIKKIMSAVTASWTPGSIASASRATTTVTMTGAALGDVVSCGPSITITAGMILTAWVSAVNTVTVQLQNQTGAANTPGTLTVRVQVSQY